MNTVRPYIFANLLTSSKLLITLRNELEQGHESCIPLSLNKIIRYEKKVYTGNTAPNSLYLNKCIESWITLHSYSNILLVLPFWLQSAIEFQSFLSAEPRTILIKSNGKIGNISAHVSPSTPFENDVQT